MYTRPSFYIHRFPLSTNFLTSIVRYRLNSILYRSVAKSVSSRPISKDRRVISRDSSLRTVRCLERTMVQPPAVRAGLVSGVRQNAPFFVLAARSSVVHTHVQLHRTPPPVMAVIRLLPSNQLVERAVAVKSRLINHTSLPLSSTRSKSSANRSNEAQTLTRWLASLHLALVLVPPPGCPLDSSRSFLFYLCELHTCRAVQPTRGSSWKRKNSTTNFASSSHVLRLLYLNVHILIFKVDEYLI